MVVFARSNSCIYSYPNIPGKTIYTICVNFYPLNDHLYEIEDLNTKHNFQNLKITVLQFFSLDELFKEKVNETSYFAQKLVGYEYMCKLCTGVYVFLFLFFFFLFFLCFFFLFSIYFVDSMTSCDTYDGGLGCFNGPLVSDCRFGVSPVNYPDPDPDPDRLGVPWDQNCTVKR